MTSDPSIFVTTQVGGADCLTAPEFISDVSYVRGQNLSSRGGVLHTRPRFRKLSTLPAGRFQGAYTLGERLYVILGGTVYFYTPQGEEDWSAVDGISFSPYVDMVYATEVYSDFLFMNDGVHMPAIVGPYANRQLSTQETTSTNTEGEEETTSDPEIPCGSLCCFGQGRIFFFTPNQKVLMAGDIYIPGDPKSCLKFTEYAFLNESLAIQQPDSFGKAMSMRFVRSSESGTGLGQLVVFYMNGFCVYNVYEARSTWLDTQLGQVIGTYNGGGGFNFTIQKNNDVFFRTGSGLTTLRDFASQTSQGLRTLPVTIPITPLLERDQAWTLEQGSISAHNNRSLFTHGLRLLNGEAFYDSLISFDMASFYGGGEMNMTFDGFWTGPRITKTLTGTLHGNVVSLVTAKTADGGNTLWTLQKDVFDDNDVPPRSRWYSKGYSFGSAFQYAKFLMADIWLQDLRSDVEVTLYFRSDSALWQEASSGSVRVPYYTKDPAAGGGTINVLPQGRAKLRIAVADEICDPVSMREIRYGTAFQFCLEINGTAATPKMWFHPQVVSGDTGEKRLCETEETGILLSDAVPDSVWLYDYDTGFLE